MLVVLGINTFSAYLNIELIAENDRATIEEMRSIVTGINLTKQITLDRHQAELSKNLVAARMSLVTSAVLQLLLLSILYWLINIDVRGRIQLRQRSRLSAEISQKIRQSLQLEEILQTTVEEVQKLLDVDRVLIFRFEPDGVGIVVQEQVLADYPIVMGSKIFDPCFDSSYHARYEQGRIYSIPDITQAGFQPCYVEFLQSFAVRASSIVPIHLRDKLWGLLIIHQCRSVRVWPQNEIDLLIQIANQIGIALAQSQLLQQERQQQEELLRSNTELEQFAYIASHDLQEPLRMVISYLELLERRYQGKLDSDADEFIRYAVDGAVRMRTLIQALLSYARVSSRGKPFKLVSCTELLKDALTNLHVAIRESGAIITSDLLPEIEGDPSQLTQLFQNLIANALKFCPDVPPQIHISATQIDTPVEQATARELNRASWEFRISDNGIGIEPQYLERIFVIFQRLHSRSDYSGTGIGLAICKRIVERHGGKIWVKSHHLSNSSANDQTSIRGTSCRGSTFYFIIPGIGSISAKNASNYSSSRDFAY